MKSRRHNEPQFDLPIVGLEFNLRAEQGTDFERIARERRESEAHLTVNEQGQPELEESFCQPIARYTRRQAIEDGVLVDLMQGEMGRIVIEAGFRHPVAMTIGAFTATISVIGKPLPEGQDIEGRLWDVLWMFSCAVKAERKSKDRTTFQVRIWDGTRHNVVELWSLIGPGDDASPVITIMLQGED